MRLQRPRDPVISLDLEPLVLEVELALQPVHDLVGDLARVSELDDDPALGLQHFADRALVDARAFLQVLLVFGERSAVQTAGPLCESSAPKVVEPDHPLDRVVAGPPFTGKLVQALQRGFGGSLAGEQLFALGPAVVLDPQRADQPWQREPLGRPASRGSPRRRGR